MGIKEDLETIKSMIKEQEKEKTKKKFRIPFGKRVGKAQKRKNYVTLILLKGNNQLDFKKVQIIEQTIMEEEIPRLAGAGYVFYYKKNPFIILPDWSLEPLAVNEEEKIPLIAFNSGEDYKKSLSDGRNTVGFRLLFSRMKSEMISTKKTMGGWVKWAFIIGVVGIILYALLSGGA